MRFDPLVWFDMFGKSWRLGISPHNPLCPGLGISIEVGISEGSPPTHPTQASLPNQTEMCGIMRWFLTLKVGCMKQLLVATEALQFLVRVGAMSSYPGEFEHITGWVDEVLCALLMKSRSQKTADEMWIDCNQKVLSLIIPQAKLMKIMGCRGRPSEHLCINRFVGGGSTLASGGQVCMAIAFPLACLAFACFRFRFVVVGPGAGGVG